MPANWPDLAALPDEGGAASNRADDTPSTSFGLSTGPVEPQGVLNDLIRQRMPDLAQNESVDPQAVLNRLIRRQQEKLDQRATQTAPNGQPKFSDYGVPKDQAPPDGDFSKYGEPAEGTPENPITGEVPVEDKDTPYFLRKLGQSAVSGVGATLQGLGNIAAITPSPAQPGEADINVPENVPNGPAPTAAQTPVYKAGKSIKEAAKTAFPITEQEEAEHPIQSTIAGAFGGMMGPLALGMIDPIAGIAGGAAMFGLSGAGDTYEEAIKHGASEETARQAATLSGVVNTVLGGLPVASVFKPFTKFMPEASGLGMRILYQAAQNGIVFGSVGEAQEYLGQQIAKMYDPSAGYSFSTERLIGELIAGGALGALHASLEKHEAQQANAGKGAGTQQGEAQPQPQPQPGEGGGERGLPPGGEREQNGWTDANSPHYWKEDGSFDYAAYKKDNPSYDRKADPNPWNDKKYYTAENGDFDHQAYDRDNFSRSYRSTAGAEGFEERVEPDSDEPWRSRYRTSQGGAGAQQPPPGGAGPQAAPKEKPQPFETKLKPSVRLQLEDAAAYYKEHDRDTIRSWSDDELKDYVNRKFGFGSKRADDDEILRRYGHSDEDIKAMSPEEKAAAVAEALRSGHPPMEGEPEHGTRGAPIDLKTGADVERAAGMARQDHTHPQGEANNVQRGHATWNGLDITFETAAGGVRKGVRPDGTPFETTHPHAYGYFTGLPKAADGMSPDVIVGDHPGAPTVYVIDEIDRKTGKYRQPKTFVGFNDPKAVYQSYAGISSKSTESVGGMRAFPAADFPELARKGLLSKPVSDAMYKESGQKPAAGGQETPGKTPGKTPEASPKTPQRPSQEPTAEEQADEGMRGLTDLFGGPAAAAPEKPSPEHHAAIEAALKAVGVDPHQVRPVDIARAAEIHANEGLPPGDAFQLAIVRAAVEDGLMTPQQVKEQYGEEIHALLEPAGAPPLVVSPAASGAATRGEAAAPAGERVRGGGAPGAQGDHERTGEAAEAGKAEGAEGAEHDHGEAANTEAGEHPVRGAAGGERAAKGNERGTGGETPDRNAAENEPAGNAAPAAIEGGKPFAGMVENAEEYAAAAKKRRESGQQGTVTEFKSHRAEEAARHGRTVTEANEERAKLVAEHEKKLVRALKEAKVARDEVNDEIWNDAVGRMIDHGYEPMDAIDAAFLKFESDSVQRESEESQWAAEEQREAANEAQGKTHHVGGAQPAEAGETRAGETAAVSEGGEARAQAGERGGGEERGATTGGERPSGGTERTAAGEQHILPGAEHISDAELAKRRAAEPLKPGVAQKPADEGLFGEGHKQTDLVDQANAAAKKAEAEGKVVAEAEVTAADTGEPMTVKLTKDGPWDFNDTFPAPDPERIKALEENGRENVGTDDVEGIVSVLDETLNGMMSDFATLRAAGRLLQKAKAGQKPPGKKKITPEQWAKELRKDIAHARESLAGTKASVEDQFGPKAASAMVQEVRKRVLQEEKSSENPDEAVNNRLEEQRNQPAAEEEDTGDVLNKDARQNLDGLSAVADGNEIDAALKAKFLEGKLVKESKKGLSLTSEGKRQLARGREIERNLLEHQGKLDELPKPDDIPALKTLYREAVEDYNRAIMDGVAKDAHEASERMDLLQERANDNTTSGVKTEESPAHELRIDAAAPIGTIPKWGQEGVFEINVGGVRCIVTHEQWLSDAIYAPDGDKPFPSETGFRSFAGRSGMESDNILGKTVDQHWRELIAETIKKEYPGGAKTMPKPDVWYRLPKSYEEDEGKPVKIGGEYGTSSKRKAGEWEEKRNKKIAAAREKAFAAIEKRKATDKILPQQTDGAGQRVDVGDVIETHNLGGTPYEGVIGRLYKAEDGVEIAHVKSFTDHHAEVPLANLRKVTKEGTPPAEPEPPKPEMLQDVGEKIGGARKDQWAQKGLGLEDIKDMTGAEKAKNITKENVFPRPDYVDLVDNGGVDPQAAFLIKRIYDRIATKPKESRQEDYITALKMARELLSAAKTTDDVDNIEVNFRKVAKEAGHESWGLLQAIEQERHRFSPLHVMQDDLRLAERAVKQDGFPNIEPWQRTFAVRERQKYNYEKKAYDASDYAVYRRAGGTLGHFDTKELAIEAAKKAYEESGKGRGEGEEPKRPHLDEVLRTGPDMRNGSDVDGQALIDNFGVRGVEFGNWAASDERQKVVNLGYDALHDLSRVLKVPPKALALDGTLGIGFGSRGQGGKAAAHYEPGRLVINMTKLTGAGSLAHEWGHAFDHYLGEVNTDRPYGGAPKSISGWREPGGKSFPSLHNLSPRLARAAGEVMDVLFHRSETDEEHAARIAKLTEHYRSGIESWEKSRARIQEQMRKGGSSKGLKKAEDQIRIWNDSLARKMRDIEKRDRLDSNYFKEAKKLSGKSGVDGYWARPNELFARAFESYVFDKIAAEGHSSQYLVQGVEPDRFRMGNYRGNPYPAGEEREAINKAFDKLFAAIDLEKGKLGEKSRIVGKTKEDWTTPQIHEMWRTPTITDITPIKPVTPEQKIEQTEQEMADLAQASAERPASERPSVLADHFAQHFTQGGKFENIIAARKFAKEKGFDYDPKMVEEAIEQGIVKAARKVAEPVAAGGRSPEAVFDYLKGLYDRQPRLGTRTSTSMRDQAYSTPIPLAYAASRLAEIDRSTTVYEPTAGNGALLIEADPSKTVANELNPDRAQSLRDQGFKTETNDASDKPAIEKVDRVIANPPFGTVGNKTFDLTDIQPGYWTNQIDHAIALRSLEPMRDGGRAVLILGGVNKLKASPQERRDGYSEKAKRQFFKALYDRYNVTDHFTVNGDLYAKQGAEWPVDVIVINGRGKSLRRLPAADPPRILDTWDQIKALLNERPGENTAEAPRPDAGPPGGVPGPEGGNVGPRPSGVSGVPDHPESGQPEGVRPGTVRGRPGDENGGAGAREPNRPGVGGEPGNAPGKPPTIDLEALLNDAINGPQAGPKSSEPPRAQAKPRTKAESAKSAAANAAEAAEEGMKGLTELFGGGKTIGMAGAFDPETYEKAKPHFIKAAYKFADFIHDVGEFVRRFVDELRNVYKWTTEMLNRAMQYLLKFVEDVQAGKIKLGLTREEPRKRETETEGQVAYEPKSNAPGLGTLVPKNMKAAIDASLAKVAEQISNRYPSIDAYVADELGYTPQEMAEALSAEQVDALALAIHNLDNGHGFIIGDQTGIGKGRVNAALIRWALKKGITPIFVTEKPNLYKDIYRDLSDISIGDVLGGKDPRFLMTNAGVRVPLTDDGDVVIKSPGVSEHNATLNSLTPENFKDKHDVVFTTYNQMQTVAGNDTARRSFLSRMAPNSLFLFDESHNAGGDVNARPPKQKPGQPPPPPNRAQLARSLIAAAGNRAFYSSGTYAKRPDVMDLYSATDMAMAVDKISDLAEAIQRGGVPMQQAVASMLAEAGQYIRRERSFDGVDYNTPVVPVDRAKYDGIAHSLAAVNDFSHLVTDRLPAIIDELAEIGGTASANSAAGDAGVTSINFTSVMHNLISQMLLSMKAEPAAQAALQSIKEGRKPILTVANTLETFLNDTAADLGLKHGDKIKLDFSGILHRYLKRVRTITIKPPFEDQEPIKHYLTDEQLGPAGVRMFDTITHQINALDLKDLSVSPIDHIKGVLKRAGYSVGEITGRKSIIDYTDPKNPILSSRPGKDLSIAGRNETISKFNGGPHDAMIMNQAGSTGLSLHASEKYKDQRQREMFIVQAEADVDKHMQMLGRPHRTGQVVVPTYSQMVADIPAEKRFAAVLAKKMASLNANTTASRKGALTAKDVPDFMNQYGDMVAANWAMDNPEINWRMDSPVAIDDHGRPKVENAMQRVTGRLMLLPLADQEQVLDHLEEEYKTLIEQLDAAGENGLEAKALDLKAQTTQRTEVVPKRNESGSPFAAPVVMERAKVARQGKPFKPEEVVKKVQREVIEHGGKETLDELTTQIREYLKNERLPQKSLDEFSSEDVTPAQWRQIQYLHGKWDQAESAFRTPRQEVTPENAPAVLEALSKTNGIQMARQSAAHTAFREYSRDVLDGIGDAAKQEKERGKLHGIRERWQGIDNMMRPGARIYLKTTNGNITGILLKVEQKGEPKNPLALSTWKATFAIPDATRQVTLPYSRLYTTGNAPTEDAMAIEAEPVAHWVENVKQTLERFQHGQSDAKEDRYIATGNILAAYDWLGKRGQIIHFTDDKGNVRQGVLTARGFDMAAHARTKGKILQDPAEVKKYLNENRGESVWSSDNVVRITSDGYSRDYYRIDIVPSRKTGGRYFLDKELTDLTGDFYKRGGTMQTAFNEGPGNPVTAVIARLQQLGAKFTVPADSLKTEDVEPSASETKPYQQQRANLPALTSAADTRRADLEKTLTNLIGRLTGKRVNVQFPDTMKNRGQGYGEGVEPTAGGEYLPWSNLIRIALNDPEFTDPKSTAFHEAYHWIEDHTVTDREMALLKREEPRIRAAAERFLAATHPKIDPATIKKFVEDLSDYEARAFGAQGYAFDRSKGGTGEGLHIGVRALWERILRFFRQLANALRGLGFQRYEDIFGKFYEGEMAKRPDRMLEEGRPSRIAEQVVAEREPSAAMARAKDYTIEKRPSGKYWLKSTGAQRPLSIHDTAAEARVERQRLRASDARYLEILNKPYEPSASMAKPTGKGFHHNAPPENEHLRPEDYRPDNPLSAASWSIRRKIADLIGSDKMLTFKENVQDFNARVERMQNAVEARSRNWVADDPESPLPDDQQFYQLKRLFPGKRANRMEVFNKDYFGPLADTMRTNGITSQQAGDYLYAKHAPERNANVGPLHPPESDFYKAMADHDIAGASGMSTNEANRIAREFEEGPKGEAFRDLAKKAGAIRQFISTEMIRGSLESQETISEWWRQAPNYVPLRGWEDPTEAPQFADQRPKGFSGDIKGPETQRALGRRSKADNPLVGLIDQAYRTIDRAEKNLALHGLARMLKAAGPEMRKELGVTFDRGRPKRVVDQTTGLVKWKDDSWDQRRENAVHMKVRGRDQYVIFDDLRVARAAKTWAPSSGPVTQVLNHLLGKWKSLLTHYNPEFMARHAARYYVEGLLNAFEQKERGGFSPGKYALGRTPDHRWRYPRHLGGRARARRR